MTNENDMTRKMLDALRSGDSIQRSRMIEESDEFETTRKMLDVLNEAKSRPDGYLITEEVESDVIKLEGSELKDEQDKFRDVIGQRVEFGVFNIYPEANNVVFGGRFQDMGGLEWQFSLEEDDGVYITGSNIKLTTSAVDRLQRLRGYYENWSEEWAQKLASEYRRNV